MSQEVIAPPAPPAEPQFSAELTAQTIVAAFRSLPYSAMSNVLCALEQITAARFKELTERNPNWNSKPQPPLTVEGDERKRCMAEEAKEKARLMPCDRCGKIAAEHPQPECGVFVKRKPVTMVAPLTEMLEKRHPHIGRSERRRANASGD